MKFNVENYVVLYFDRTIEKRQYKLEDNSKKVTEIKSSGNICAQLIHMAGHVDKMLLFFKAHGILDQGVL